MVIWNSSTQRTGHLWILVLFFLAVGCAIPGRLYRVAPAISGVVRNADQPLVDSNLRLEISHRESPELHDTQRLPLTGGGRFSFERVDLAVAGHEYSKNYRAFLHFETDGRERVIWRAQFSRRALASAIVLDCDLSRTVRHGQPCWVEDPLQQPWLIEEGARNYQRLCASCHGAEGRGNPALASSVGGMPPDLSAIAARRNGRFDRAEVAEWIEGRTSSTTHGTRRMPAWGEVLSAEFERYSDGDELIGATLDPLVVYLESLQRSD